MKLAGVSALATGLMLGTGQPAEAGTLSFQEGVSPTGSYTMDATYIRSKGPTGNGPGDILNNDPEVELLVGTYSDQVFRGLFEFDVSAIPNGDQIDSASLVLTTHATRVGLDDDVSLLTPNTVETFNLYTYGSDIDETTATWNAPDSGDTDVDGGTLGTLLSSATFDVTANSLAVTFGDSAAFRTAVSDANAGDGLLRLILVIADESVPGSPLPDPVEDFKFARFQPDNSDDGGRPELIVTHSIPEPGSLALMGLGGLCLLKRRRR